MNWRKWLQHVNYDLQPIEHSSADCQIWQVPSTIAQSERATSVLSAHDGSTNAPYMYV
jgi:hypothetical protein